MIEQIESVGPELRRQLFVDPGVFVKRQIDVFESGADDRVAAHIPEAGWHLEKAVSCSRSVARQSWKILRITVSRRPDPNRHGTQDVGPQRITDTRVRAVVGDDIY